MLSCNRLENDTATEARPLAQENLKGNTGGRGEELTDGSKHLCRREAFVLIRLKPEAEGK